VTSSVWRRVEPFLYSRKNIAGVIGALAGVGLLALGITTGIVGLGVIAGLYAIGYLVVPAERGVALSRRDTMDAREIENDLRKLLISIYGRVAEDVFTKAGSICHSIVETLPKSGESYDSTDPNLHLISRTALDYLPQALNAYLAIPRIYAERRPLADGRTAHDALMEQLNVMDAKLHEVAEDMARNDTDKLLANVRFLQERFASSALQPESVSSTAGSASDGAADQGKIV
jgi:hypothetical protein